MFVRNVEGEVFVHITEKSQLARNVRALKYVSIKDGKASAKNAGEVQFAVIIRLGQHVKIAAVVQYVFMENKK